MKGKDRYMVLDANIRKPLIIATVAMMALTGCTDEQFEGAQPDNSSALKAIQMGNTMKAITRADKTGLDAAGALNYNFIVEGFKSQGTLSNAIEVFKYYNVNYYYGTANSTESNSGNWEYADQNTVNSTEGRIDIYSSGDENTGITPIPVQSIKYWDPDYSQYDFVAFAQGKGTEIDGKPSFAKFSEVNRANIGSAVNPVYQIKGTVAELGAAYIADLVTIYQAEDRYQNASPVTPKFFNASAKVRMAIYETVPGYSVKDVRFYQSASEPSKTKSTVSELSETPTLLSVSADDYITPDPTLSTGSGTMSVFYPVTGKDNVGKEGYNKAVLTFTAEEDEDGESNTASALTFNALKYGPREMDETDNKYIYLGRTSNNAVYAGKKDIDDYVMVIPTGKGHVLKLRVAYTLVPTDGGDEKIVMEDAMAIVPAQYADWKQSYAYTYIFKISEKTGEGLYPITFDAVVMDSEDGIQETVTEVSNPSITTYQQGRVVSENDEYLKNNNIFVVVDNGKPLFKDSEDAGHVTLFKAVLTGGLTSETNAANVLQGITEATVENCFDNGVYVPAIEDVPATWTVTDAAGGTLVLTDITDAKLNVSNYIASQYTTDGRTWGINNANFIPAEDGYYVFQYKVQAASDVVYYDFYNDQCYEMYSDFGWSYYNKHGYYPYIYSQEEFDALPESDRIKTPAKSVKYAYKVIKVGKESPLSFDVLDDDDWTDIQGAKRTR